MFSPGRLSWTGGCFTVKRVMRIATNFQLRHKNDYAPCSGVASSWPRETFAPLTIDAPSGV